jgi:hypothetical protein
MEVSMTAKQYLLPLVFEKGYDAGWRSAPLANEFVGDKLAAKTWREGYDRGASDRAKWNKKAS